MWHVQDHYENIYAVVKGRKIFTLLPPSDAYRLYFQTCQVARYHRDAAGALVLQPEEPHHVRAIALHNSIVMNELYVGMEFCTAEENLGKDIGKVLEIFCTPRLA